MSEQEFKEFVDQLKDQGLSDEDILGIFYEAFSEGELSREDLDAAAKAMGYQAKKEFMEDSDLDEENSGEEGGEVKGLNKDQIEAAKEFKEGESEEDYKERVAEGEEAGESEDEEDEEDEREEAMKLF